MKKYSLSQDAIENKGSGEINEQLARAMETAIDGIAIIDRSQTFIYLNPAYAQIFGYVEPRELLGKPWRMLYAADELDRFDKRIIPDLGRTGRYRGDAVGMKKNGGLFDQEISLTSIDSEGMISVVRDVAEKKQAQKDKEKLQAQFLQAQKMEAVGRLAGGMAHDFNNMLGVIIGYGEMVQSRLKPEDPLQAEVAEMMTAARRSAEITRKLLAFARRQTVSPKVLDLNDTVEGMLRLMRRIIGEDIDFSWQPGPGLWPVKVDPCQIEQVMANLWVNARDAITGVGRITIETGNVRIDADRCGARPDVIPGDYVILCVRDNGCGMDEETKSHLFEPFFTTKEVGRGTGPGLATVYGIVTQNNGFIHVQSELGAGTTFRIHLPRHSGLPEKAETPKVQPIRESHGETILVVEDEVLVLNLTHAILESLGYRVLAASNPAEAERQVRDHQDRIDLLITDVVMPEMNGRDLTRRLQGLRPDLKVLYMSGYTANVIAHRDVLDTGVHFIQKPFRRAELAEKVREVLSQ